MHCTSSKDVTDTRLRGKTSHGYIITNSAPSLCHFSFVDYSPPDIQQHSTMAPKASRSSQRPLAPSSSASGINLAPGTSRSTSALSRRGTRRSASDIASTARASSTPDWKNQWNFYALNPKEVNIDDLLESEAPMRDGVKASTGGTYTGVGNTTATENALQSQDADITGATAGTGNVTTVGENATTLRRTQRRRAIQTLLDSEEGARETSVFAIASLASHPSSIIAISLNFQSPGKPCDVIAVTRDPERQEDLTAFRYEGGKESTRVLSQECVHFYLIVPKL
ncbi:hypothetical protein BCR39DRAFT_548203 [Naematelia encephala]|uniref:Uncharacterized protein n=1 Tax=Naematelia encephala TaxID=71784 RepID=A0A1Y2ANG2_9TREE|nr:hypothetical protein BCR39DRAFT_548203 [Naematelia encephala]